MGHSDASLANGPVLQRALEAWQEKGWERFTGGSTALEGAARDGVVTALATYLEAVGLAAEAVGRGDVALAQELLEQAAHVTAAVSTGSSLRAPGPVGDESDTPAQD